MNPDNNRPGQSNQQETMGFDKYVAIALVVGLIAGFVIGHSVGSSKADENKNGTSTDSILFNEKGAETTSLSGESNTATALGSIAGTGTKVEVSNQKEGNNVVIKKLVLDKPYWVAIRDSHMDNKFPYILGAKKVAAGEYSDLSIYANRATVSGKRYDVVFYKDSAKFNYDASMLVMDGDHPAGATFEAN